MNQDDKNNDLQKAINEVTQAAPAPQTEMPTISQHGMGMADTNNKETDDAAVAAAMASVLPGNDNTASDTSTSADNSASIMSPVSGVDDVNISHVKEEALRELSPLLDKTQLEPEPKFKIYRDMIETLHENSLLMPALEAAKQIQDESARAEALLSLVNLIDELGIK